MIDEPTVLVLGAGASQPYGFPTGRELLKQVCNLDIAKMPEAVRPDAHEMKQFQTELQSSARNSVDAFLEHRDEYEDLGKKAMAHCLLSSESRAQLHNLDDDSWASWYRYLFGSMDTKFERFHENKVRVVTFNYDRSLEQFLCTSLCNAYGKSKHEAAQQLEQIEIVHVHGQLGQLPWRSGSDVDVVDFGKPEPKEIMTAVKSIKIVSEGIDDTPEFEAAHRLMRWAKRIYFLGFGYAPVNLVRLGFKAKDKEPYGDDKIIGGTALGLTDVEIAKYGRERCAGIEMKANHDVLNFLRNDFDFIAG